MSNWLQIVSDRCTGISTPATVEVLIPPGVPITGMIIGVTHRLPDGKTFLVADFEVGLFGVRLWLRVKGAETEAGTQ